MSTVKQIAKLDAKITDRVSFGRVPRGERFDVAFEGRLDGEIDGTMEGVDYTTVTLDGVVLIDVRGVITTHDGAKISASVVGHCDTRDGLIHDSLVQLCTSAPKYDWLNKASIIGKGQMSPLLNGQDAEDGTKFQVTYYAATDR